mmetsp:Transcript_12547/g.25437  ORF Transcript_12547/g.25437 Transcript_12547/m.25437 type:complete len:495 (+) Transcript_12547:143-1627(+)|eukprot:CAMPEP_0171342698 /NCGR_PEP_ID=MMETSP0878-20121228/15132_1 /TAXON_ID=67004 /ORGANISM="Thalassiosira weissflogii, Strain CCMP1336" /LENGTH=494 /DNA_ID=CAMNT_0011845443 /DNA_START=6 /DNA_END=1490 /DNA_ORIENTATION=-
MTSTSPQIATNDEANVGISITTYGSTADDAVGYQSTLSMPAEKVMHNMHNSFTSLKDVASRVAFLDNTKCHHHEVTKPSADHSTVGTDDSSPLHRLRHHHHANLGNNMLYTYPIDGPDSTDLHKSSSNSDDESSAKKVFFSHSNLRKLALDLSLYINIFILLTKFIAYLETLSLSVLAALVDSILDVVSQWILAYTERRSSKTRSSAFYPAGASRLEPLGVLSCAALMGFASFGVLKEAMEKLVEGLSHGGDVSMTDENRSSVWSMSSVVIVKLGLWGLCQKVGHVREEETKDTTSLLNGGGTAGSTTAGGGPKYYVDSTLEALAQDHWNDCLSNAVAAMALLFALSNEHFWILDPIGAIVISLYIIFSWYSTGKEQIEQLTGKAAPSEFIDELYEMANNFDAKMEVDVVRAYHFGPKFLVELEVVLPRDTLLFESHDMGMELQYEIESREEVERCFVHIDYESRPYDEHVVSKVPELRERYRPYGKMNSAVSI